MRIIWSPLAMQRIREATKLIATDKPRAARRWAEAAFRSVERLGELPLGGRVVPELGRADVREVIYGEYRIVFRVSSDSILILTVRHGRRLIDEAEMEE